MTEESFDCVDMKRQIQEQLRKAGPRQPLDAWNKSVLAQLRKDPHLNRFNGQVVNQDAFEPRKVV